MRCGDLERYLEAFIDGRLTRSRSAVLRRHLASCGGCQARVERLRQFERDTNRRFRAVEQPGSLWEGLEPDMVDIQGAMYEGRLLAPPRVPVALPAPPRGAERPVKLRPEHYSPVAARTQRRGTASGLAGLLLIAMAFGAVYQFARGESGRPQGGDAVLAYLDYRRDAVEPAFLSEDSREASQWLTSELGVPVPPQRVPEGYRLMGASRAALADGDSGALVYGRETGTDPATVMLFVRPERGLALPSEPPVALDAAAAAGVHELAWQSANLRYNLVGLLSEAELRRFVPDQ
jgi:anti-sigma factor RsiW